MSARRGHHSSTHEFSIDERITARADSMTEEGTYASGHRARSTGIQLRIRVVRPTAHAGERARQRRLEGDWKAIREEESGQKHNESDKETS